VAPSLITSYYVTTNPNSNSNTLTTPSFTPSTGEVIIVKAATWDSTISMGTPTGGSQTYTLRASATAGGFNTWVGIWSATISGSPGSMTISSTPSAASWHNMVVERWSGAQLAASPATSTGNSTSAPASASLTTTAANSVVSWLAGDAQSVDPATRAYLSSATEENVDDGHVGSNGVFYFAYQAAATAGSQSYGLSAPTGMKYWIAGIEVQAAASASAAFVAAPPSRRRTTPPPRRSRITTAPAAANSPIPSNRVRQPRAIRGLLARRPRVAAPVPAQVVVTPPAYPPRSVRPRLNVLRLFRGRSAAPIPAQVVIPPPAYPPTNVRARVRGLRFFRGRASAPIPAQVAVVPPAYPLQSVRERVRGLRLFRGRSGAPLPAQITVASRAAGVRTKWPRWVRGRATAPAVAQAMVPPGQHARPRTVVPRRGRAATPLPQQVAPAVPAYVPLFTRAKKRIARLFRTRAATSVAPPGVAPPTAFTSPNPEIYTASSNGDLATSSYAPDLITETNNPDLEA
jgi:hypothetical protein